MNFKVKGEIISEACITKSKTEYNCSFDDADDAFALSGCDRSSRVTRNQDREGVTKCVQG